MVCNNPCDSQVGSRFVWAASSTVFAIMDDAWVRFQSRAQQLRHVLQTRSALAILHAYHVVVLDAAIAVLDAIRWFPTGQERLERILQATASFLFAGQYRTGKRESVPYALVNVVDTRFHLHQDYAARLAKEFPWVAEQASTCEIDHPHTVHFLALISKLAYESRPVISDFVARKWGLQVQFVTAGTSSVNASGGVGRTHLTGHRFAGLAWSSRRIVPSSSASRRLRPAADASRPAWTASPLSSPTGRASSTTGSTRQATASEPIRVTVTGQPAGPIRQGRR